MDEPTARKAFIADVTAHMRADAEAVVAAIDGGTMDPPRCLADCADHVLSLLADRDRFAADLAARDERIKVLEGERDAAARERNLARRETEMILSAAVRYDGPGAYSVCIDDQVQTYSSQSEAMAVARRSAGLAPAGREGEVAS